MAKYKEPVKKLENLRYYTYNFHIYGYKMRDDFNRKSARIYDSEKRRIESIIGKYFHFKRDSEGKTVFISINAQNIFHNPFHNIFKIKSFTKNDITLHYIILDILRNNSSLTVNTIIDIMETDYLSEFDNYLIIDSFTVRKKLEEYVSKGIVLKNKDGKNINYTYNNLEHINYNKEAVKFFTMYSPVGVIGSYFNLKNDIFSFKHEYIFHALDSEVIYKFLNAIYEERLVEVSGYSRDSNLYNQRLVPIKVLISVQGGRCYALCYSLRKNRLINIRIDRVVEVKQLEKCADYIKYQQMYEGIKSNMWGCSLSTRIETVSIQFKVEENEMYIVERLKKEARNGEVSKLEDNIYQYVTKTYDAIELLPWIRSFICRIIKLESTNKQLLEMFENDLNTMEEMYGDKNDF